MNRVINCLVRRRGMVILLCLLLLIPSLLGMAATKTRYDLLYYLPQDLDTVKGQNILLEDFGKGAFSLLVTEGMSIPEQREMENALKQIPHVDSVIGFASLTNGTLPLEIVPPDLREKFSRGDCMLSAVFFDEGSSSEETMEAIEQVRKTAGEKCFVSGLSAVVTDTKKLVESQEAVYVGIAVALCAVVLMLTMDSFLLPLIFLACIGVSILWNLGSNYFLGEISYITKAVAAVLQLGVTLDYSIFLWHSYREQKQLLLSATPSAPSAASLSELNDRAMVNAIRLTFTSILGSSLTTVAGFVSICFMSFTLGRDLGVVMSKGVVLGVLATVVLLPCVIRLLDGAIEKTSHKPFLPDLGGIGRFVVKHYKALAVLLLVLIVPAFFGYANVNVYYDMSKVMPKDLQSVAANQKLEQTFDMATTHLLLVDSSVPPHQVRAMSEEMSRVDGVKGVLGLDTLLGADVPENIVPPDLLSLVKSDRYRLLLVNSAYVISSDEVNAQIDALNAILKKYDAGGLLIGEAPCTKDLIACTDHDFAVVSLISIAAIFLIILLVQQSLSLPVLLVAVIELAIAANLCLPYYFGQSLPFVAPILISTIQLGATVDYAILMTTRYKQNRLSGLSAKEAVGNAVSSAARSILVSGLGFFAATYGVGLYANVDMISSLCRLIARGALLSVAVVLLLLPAVLLLADRLIVRTTLDMRSLKQ